MSATGLSIVLSLAGLLFVLGLIGVLVRRNIVFILIAIEIMLNACGLAFVAAGAFLNEADGQVMFFFILAMSATEVAVGLGLVLQIFHKAGTLDVDALKELRY